MGIAEGRLAEVQLGLVAAPHGEDGRKLFSFVCSTESVNMSKLIPSKAGTGKRKGLVAQMRRQLAGVPAPRGRAWSCLGLLTRRQGWGGTQESCGLQDTACSAGTRVAVDVLSLVLQREPSRSFLPSVVVAERKLQDHLA